LLKNQLVAYVNNDISPLYFILIKIMPLYVNPDMGITRFLIAKFLLRNAIDPTVTVSISGERK